MNNTSFDKIIDRVFDGFKKISPALVAISILTGLMIFLPDNILEQLGLSNLDQFVNSIVGILFLLSITLIVTILISTVFNNIRSKINNIVLIKKLRKKYLRLSKHQKEIIIVLLSSSSKSIKLDVLSGDTVYLIQNKFIYKPNQVIDQISLYDNMFTFVPEPWLMDLYQKEPGLFKKDKNKM